MTRYTELWREVDARLRNAFAWMRADAPALAARVDVAFHGWLDHNELEMALDQLLDAAEDGATGLRRHFWEGLLTAAMRMGLERQFLRIVDRIPDLEPHVFGTAHAPPYVYCDFNAGIQTDVYSLDGVGTALDFARLRVVPFASQRLTLYQEDGEPDGTPTWMVASAVVAEHEPHGLVAKVVPGSWRSEPRSA